MKRAACLLCVLCLLLVMAGCARQEEPVPGKKSITVWWAQWEPAAGLQELGSEFEKETGIVVKVHQIPWSAFQDQVFLNFGQKQTDFDIVVGDSQWIGRGATKGLYLDLTDWLPGAVDMKKLHSQAVKYLCEYPPGSARYFAAPCETDAIGFAYRADWFEDTVEKATFRGKYGRMLAPPETWEEFRQVAEFFTRPQEKRYGCALLTGRGYDSLVMGFQQLMWAFGGSWGDEKTFKVKGFVNSPGAVEALTFMKEMLNFAPRGAENFDYAKTQEAFINGSSAMSMMYFAFAPGVVKQMGERAGFFMVPGKGDRRVISLGGQGFSISTKVSPQQQELAKQFIAWFLQTEVQKKWITKEAGFTANTEILASEEFKSASPYNEAFSESLDYTKDFWSVPVYNELLAVAQQRIGEALDGAETPKGALDKLAEEHEQIFRDAGLLVQE